MAVTLNGSTVYLLWTSDEGGFMDRVFVEDGHVVSCPDLDSVRSYAQERELPLDPEDPDHAVDLDAAAAWLESNGEPDVRGLLDAWNLSWDVANSIAGVFNHRGEQLDAVYDKLFFGNNLPAMTPPGERYIPEWSSDELRTLRTTIQQGVALVRSALVPAS